MKIEVDDFTYREQRSNKQLAISMSVEGSKTINSFGVVLDISEASYFVQRVPMVLSGFLILSAEVYAVDRAFNRSKESIDGWSREFDITFKVPSSTLLQQHVEDINSLLSFLTGDYWSCSFVESPAIKWEEQEDSQDFQNISQVNLFSGGMDSLIGAIDYLENHDANHKLFLASHYDSKMGGPKKDQHNVVEKLRKQYGDKFIYINPECIAPTVSREMTCRSRSLMFLAIAILVASYKSQKVIVPENGPVSLNFPLSNSRRAACSTRTTHPLFIQKIRNLLSSWNIDVSIENPYEFKTKGEMVRECKNRDYLLAIVDSSNSCGKRSQHQYMYDNHHATHCGRCMPCMYRKAALVGYHDSTTYGITMRTLFHQPKKVSNDFYAMLNYLKRDLSDNDIKRELIIMGMKTNNVHFNDYVNLVKRTRDELKKLLLNEASLEILQYVGLR